MIKIAVLDDYQNIFGEFIDIEKYRDLEGSEKTQESLLNLLLTSFPYLKKFLKVKGLYNEDKWTLVESKRKKKVMRFRN